MKQSVGLPHVAIFYIVASVISAISLVTNHQIGIWQPPLLLDGDADLGKTGEREPALGDWHFPIGPSTSIRPI